MQNRIRNLDASFRRRTSPVGIVLSSFLLLSSVTPMALAAEVLFDRVVAVVGGVPILHSEIQDKVTKGPLVQVSYFPAKDNASEYEKALQDQINFELVQQAAEDLQIEVVDSEIEAEIDLLLQNRGISRSQLMQFLQQQDMTYERYKDDFRNQMLMRQFQGRVILPQVKITDKDLETHYLKKSGLNTDLLQLKLRQVYVRVDPSAPDSIQAAKKDLANQVHQKLLDGMDFEEIVKIYSDDESSREAGGALPPVKMKDLAPEVQAQLSELEVGQFTRPILLGGGYRIFLLEDKSVQRSDDYESQKNAMRNELQMEELSNQVQIWLNKQRQLTKIEIKP